MCIRDRYGRTHTRDVRELSGLMKIMPFLAVCYVIAGLANLGLPGLSGFIAEMTIFTGSFQHPDTFPVSYTHLAELKSPTLLPLAEH